MRQVAGCRVLPLEDSAGQEGGVPHGRSEFLRIFVPLCKIVSYVFFVQVTAPPPRVSRLLAEEAVPHEEVHIEMRIWNY